MKVGVLLSGSGVNDGSEIHESVLTMLFSSMRISTGLGQKYEN